MTTTTTDAKRATREAGKRLTRAAGELMHEWVEAGRSPDLEDGEHEDEFWSEAKRRAGLAPDFPHDEA